MNPKLITMAGPDSISLSDVNDFEAGLIFLSNVARLYPGIKFRDLQGLATGQDISTMGWSLTGGLTALGNGFVSTVGNIKDGVGDVLKDTASFIGDSTGSAVRLVSDEKVADTIARAGTAYATGGGSEGARGFFEQLGLGGKDGKAGALDGFMNFISGLGVTGKAKEKATEGPNYLPWLLGGVGVLAVVLIAKK